MTELEHGRNLAELLEACDQPAWRVAMDCDIHPSALSKYQSGARTIHGRHAGELAHYFGVSIDVILGTEPIPWQEPQSGESTSRSPSSSSS